MIGKPDPVSGFFFCGEMIVPGGIPTQSVGTIRSRTDLQSGRLSSRLALAFDFLPLLAGIAIVQFHVVAAHIAGFRAPSHLKQYS
jgi:hypothetical protein